MADHTQCHRDIDQLLAEVKRLRDFCQYVTEYSNDPQIVRVAERHLTYNVERHSDGKESQEG